MQTPRHPNVSISFYRAKAKTNNTPTTAKIPFTVKTQTLTSRCRVVIQKLPSAVFYRVWEWDRARNRVVLSNASSCKPRLLNVSSASFSRRETLHLHFLPWGRSNICLLTWLWEGSCGTVSCLSGYCWARRCYGMRFASATGCTRVCFEIYDTTDVSIVWSMCKYNMQEKTSKLSVKISKVF